ncbi:unnamed protein product [Linum trigynum]|uniref:DUF4283 domain-containing protein n=1 Tax=Linum trigynum TaxID=586398 RepID=A0AAV2GH60_9ROSI
MSAVTAPLARGGSDCQMTPETIVGQRRPPTESSSPNPKGDREAQQTKKRAKASMNDFVDSECGDEGPEDVSKEAQRDKAPQPHNGPARGNGAATARRLFGGAVRTDVWCVADSDSEDIAETIKREGRDDGFMGEEDPKFPSIHFTTAEENLFRHQYRSALVVKALERMVSYTLMDRRLQSIWAKTGGVQVTSAKNGYFLVRFTSGVDYERAITGGPWLLGDNYLTVHQWTPDFDPCEHKISSTLVWARLLQIPIHYFHPVAVMKIGNRIGKPIRVDQATSTGARSDYARVCVQVDLTKPLLSQFNINGKKYFIQYEGLEKICLQCGTYFNRTRCYCTTPMVTEDQPIEREEVSQRESQLVEEKDAIYGEWMIAKKKPRARLNHTSKGPARGRESQKKGGAPSGSRYTFLDEEEATVSHPDQHQASPTLPRHDSHGKISGGKGGGRPEKRKRIEFG